jgi:hypothetical protein
MTVLFTGSFSIPAGVNQRTAVVVPGNVKQAGRSLTCSLQMDSTAFPTGTTIISMGLSTDGGVTYHTASNTIDGPVSQDGDPFFTMTYCLGVQDVVTHARLTTSAPSAFVLPVTLGVAS